MKPIAKWLICSVVVCSSFAFTAFLYHPPLLKKGFSFPYKQAGLTKKEAAAHLISRFTYGATPGMVDAVAKQGLEDWFAEQLKAKQDDDSLKQMLAGYDALTLSNEQVLQTYPRLVRVRKLAIETGIVDKDSVNTADNKTQRALLSDFMKSKGFKPEGELFRQFINQKVLRAAYSNNQMQEVLTEFWFNHFNVALNKNNCAQFIPAYERDVIRPNVFDKFETLLLATAKSPAMLVYLDNFTSVGNNVNAKKKNSQGLNENYAREVMELHTLGVDGGYTQQDVTEAARVLTGWTLYPIDDYGPANNMRKAIEKVGEDKLASKGYVRDGDFLFAMNRHDNNDKTVLGKKFYGTDGYKEGVELLEMLAHHKSTAQFISKKLAVRFVSDNPPQSLIDKMSQTFLTKNGDIKEVLITMVSSPEFWSKDALREKTKSPFELAISTVRALDADIAYPFRINEWVTRMGQKMYYYQAPTGFPDNAQYWINTGALLNRMNFGLAVATNRIQGLKFDLAALNNNHEPESAEDALNVYSKILLPERNVSATIQRLKPLLSDPNIDKKIKDAANSTAATNDKNTMTPNDDAMQAGGDEKGMNKKPKPTADKSVASNNFGKSAMLTQVVGIIIGSPEYQRR